MAISRGFPDIYALFTFEQLQKFHLAISKLLNEFVIIYIGSDDWV